MKKDIGNPDRVGKFLNGDEIWGFKNFTLSISDTKDHSLALVIGEGE